MQAEDFLFVGLALPGEAVTGGKDHQGVTLPADGCFRLSVPARDSCLRRQAVQLTAVQPECHTAARDGNVRHASHFAYYGAVLPCGVHRLLAARATRRG